MQKEKRGGGDVEEAERWEEAWDGGGVGMGDNKASRGTVPLKKQAPLFVTCFSACIDSRALKGHNLRSHYER